MLKHYELGSLLWVMFVLINEDGEVLDVMSLCVMFVNINEDGEVLDVMSLCVMFVINEDDARTDQYRSGVLAFGYRHR